MPLLKLQTSVSIPDDKQAGLLAALSKLMAQATGKPERYVMVTVGRAGMLMSGESGPTAFADVRGIGGLTGKVNQEITQKLCDLLNQSLGIPADRVYITFTNVEASNWGCNGTTFG